MGFDVSMFIENQIAYPRTYQRKKKKEKEKKTSYSSQMVKVKKLKGDQMVIYLLITLSFVFMDPHQI